MLNDQDRFSNQLDTAFNSDLGVHILLIYREPLTTYLLGIDDLVDRLAK